MNNCSAHAIIADWQDMQTWYYPEWVWLYKWRHCQRNLPGIRGSHPNASQSFNIWSIGGIWRDVRWSLEYYVYPRKERAHSALHNLSNAIFPFLRFQVCIWLEEMWILNPTRTRHLCQDSDDSLSISSVLGVRLKFLKCSSECFKDMSGSWHKTLWHIYKIMFVEGCLVTICKATCESWPIHSDLGTGTLQRG